MVISSPSSSVSATAVVTGLDKTLDNLEIIQLIWIIFTGQIARTLVYSVRCIQCNKGSMYVMPVCFIIAECISNNV